MAVDRAVFRAMGTDAEVIVVDGPPGAAAAGRRRVDDLECRWSRFRPDTEVSRLTARAGSWVPVSVDTRLLVECARSAWALTGGAFDPTVLGDVLRAGYTASWDGPGPREAGCSALSIGCGDIEVTDGAVRLPTGTGFDPGGIGKGLAADLVVRDLLAAGAEGICVEIGGDLRVHGPSPDGGAWIVAVEAGMVEAPGPLSLLSGAVASSTSRQRTWTVDGVVRHHLIDPRSGQPAESGRVFATVVAATGWQAEALATAVMLAPAASPFDILGATDAEGLAIDADGTHGMTAGLRTYLATSALPH